MKKLLVVLIATAFVFGLVAQSAIAEDRLELSGQVRARAWSKENTDSYGTGLMAGDLEAASAGLEQTDADELKYWDQRFRMAAKITPADGVSGNLRFDFAEGTWGNTPDWDGSRYTTSELQVDRAYLEVNKGIVMVRAGQQFFGLGNNYAYDNQATGLLFQIKTPVVISLVYTKEDEGGGLTDDDDLGTEDVDHYAIDLGYATDAFSVNVFYGVQKDGSDGTPADPCVEPNMFGAMGKASFGPINVLAELNVFGGEIDYGPGTESTDFTGTQLYADVNMRVNEMFLVGVDLVYSDGVDIEDDLGDEIKITQLNATNSFGSTRYADRGPFTTDIHLLDANFAGTGSSVLDAYTGGDIFDPLGLQGGAMGGGPYVVVTPIEGLNFYANFMYLKAAEDELIDNTTVYNLAAEYMLTQNTTLAAQYSVASVDDDIEGFDIDDLKALVARIQITF